MHSYLLTFKYMFCCHMIMKLKRHETYCVCLNGINTLILHKRTVPTAKNFYMFISSENDRSTLLRTLAATDLAFKQKWSLMLCTREQQPLLCVGVTLAGWQRRTGKLIVVPSLLYWQVCW